MLTGGPSYWFHAIGGLPRPRPALPGPTDVDVAIVGGGYTGLWTAYYLKRADPTLRICVLESGGLRLRRLRPQRRLGVRRGGRLRRRAHAGGDRRHGRRDRPRHRRRADRLRLPQGRCGARGQRRRAAAAAARPGRLARARRARPADPRRRRARRRVRAELRARAARRAGPRPGRRRGAARRRRVRGDAGRVDRVRPGAHGARRRPRELGGPGDGGLHAAPRRRAARAR